MPNQHKVVRPKGQRYPGSGRVKGKPNKISVEVRQLVSELVNDVRYQHRLRRDFQLRRCHPTIESLVWQYHLGKPRQDIALSATVDVNGRIEEERKVFAALDFADLEQLAAESQALVDRARQLSLARVGTLTPPDIVSEALPDKEGAESLTKTTGSDNGYSVTSADSPVENIITPADTADSDNANPPRDDSSE